MFLGKNIDYLLKQLKINQIEFSEKINKSQATISAYINNTSTPNFETLLIIQKVLNINLHELIYVDLSKKSENSIYDNRKNESVLNESNPNYSTTKPPPPTEGVRVDLIESERDMYERLLRDKEELVKSLRDNILIQNDLIALLKSIKK